MPVRSGDPLSLTGEPLSQESTAAEALRATAGLAMRSGLLGATYRSAELEDADQAEAGFSWFGRAALNLSPFGRTAPENLSPLLTPEEGRARLRDAGLSESLSIPETGIRSDALDILMRRKREEIRRQTILRKYDGVGAPLVGSFVGSLADPTNIALAFVPVVGEARYAQLLRGAGGMLGRTGVRVGVGAAEGVVGLAPVEALNYAASVQEQADYDAYDFMLGVAGGAFFGSAMHGGAGLLGDLLRPGRWTPVPAPRPTADVVATPRAEAVTQLAAPSREAAERLMVMDRLAEGRPVTRAQVDAAVQALDQPEFRARVEEELTALASRRATPGVVAEARAVVERADRELARINERRAALGAKLDRLPGKTKRSEEYAALTQRKNALELAKEDAKATIDSNLRAVGAQEKLNTLRRTGEIPPEFKARADEDVAFVESLSDATRRALDTDPFAGVRPFVATLAPETQAAAFRMAAAQVLRGEPVNVVPAMLADPRSFDPATAARLAEANAGRADGADEAASAWADTIAPLPDDVETARALVRDTENEVNEMLKAAEREMPADEAEALADLMAKARSDGAAARAAAMCLMRTGG